MTQQIFRCYDARLRTLPGAPTLKAATHEQLVDHYKRFKQLNADVIVPRFGTEADDDDGFFESACHSILEQKDYWRQCNLVWAWIDQKPVWVSAADWGIHILPSPEKPCTRRFRLSLIGGGQIRVTEIFKVGKLFPGHSMIWCGEPELRVRAETNSGLRNYSGIISHGGVYEMSAFAVLLPPGTPPDVADRVAATLRSIDQDFRQLPGPVGTQRSLLCVRSTTAGSRQHVARHRPQLREANAAVAQLGSCKSNSTASQRIARRGHGMSTAIYEAVKNIPAFGRRDAAAEGDRLFDMIVEALRRDPTLPPRSSFEWALALANLRQQITEEIACVIVGRVDLDEVLAAVTVTL